MDSKPNERIHHYISQDTATRTSSPFGWKRRRIVPVTSNHNVLASDEELNKNAISSSISPEANANFFSRIFFMWLDPLFVKGFKNPLQLSDIWSLGPKLQVEHLTKTLENAWQEHLAQFEKDEDFELNPLSGSSGSEPEFEAGSPSNAALLASKTGKDRANSTGVKKTVLDKPSLLTATWNALFWKVFPYGFLRFIGSMATVISPLLIKYLVDYVARAKTAFSEGTPGPTIVEGFGLAIALLALQIISTTCENSYFQLAMTSGMIVRSVLTSMIYKKSMRLSSSARQRFTAGNVVNLVSSDVTRIEQFFGFMHNIWVDFFKIILISAFLIGQIGLSALAGMGLLMILGPFQGKVMRLMSHIRKSIAPLTDKRVKLIQEVFSGIRVIKLFAWEKPFLDSIIDIRKQEIDHIFRRTSLNAFVMTVAFAVPPLAAAISFAIYGATQTLDPGRVFSSLTWFGILRSPLMFLPSLLSSLADIKVAFSRITDFLIAPEIEDPPIIDPSAEYAVQINDGFFTWETLPFGTSTGKDEPRHRAHSNYIWGRANTRSELIFPISNQNQTAFFSDADIVAEPDELSPAQLSKINIAIPKGQLVAIVGSTGSGKSSLLSALLGEMRKESGDIIFSGSTGYAPQEAWIQNATVKNNILFGVPFDEKLYAATVRACALEKDFGMLINGDQTQIGEKGINLSGGQRQRINLARVVYSNCDIVLMDDPLSAVDAHVARHLFEKCVRGAMKDKTRLLVTHQLHFLPQVDYIIFMEGGRIEEMGTLNELMAKQGKFRQLMQSHGGAQANDSKDIPGHDIKSRDGLSNSVEDDQVLKTDGPHMNETQAVREFMQKEERAVGSISGNVWTFYLKAAGGWNVFLLCFSMAALSQAARVGNDYWLVAWANHSFPQFSQGAYIGIYLCWGVIQAFLTYLWGLIFAYYGVRAARVIHDKAVSNLMCAPLLYFNTTPLGRIVNRFSKDQDAMDTSLIEALRMLFSTLATSIAVVAFVCYAIPLFSVVFVPMMILYYFVQFVYQTTSRELKRLDSISRSPLYAQIGETLTGLTTIRAYQAQERFMMLNNSLINGNNAPFFLLISAARWLSLRLETLGAFLVFFAATFGILSRENVNFSASLLGLSLSYVLQVTGTLNWCVRQYTETEIAMNAVERVQHYAERVEQEAPATIEGKRPPESWPQKGDISFEKVDMRYAPDLPLVLKNVSFTIKDKEKIGIVGRTGSGKSSLMQALFRMVEPSGGKIMIDGLSTLDMGVQDLRFKLGIIPQDPVLFSGTFRRNLDPFSQYTDKQIWDALERANIKPRVAEAEGGLDGLVTEGGDNLSVGQRQLICLARAMLRHARILIMDEATANVDYETDAIIQKCLREDFSTSTILTIAHRLNTIIDYDRVMVMDQGNLVEFDSPKALLSNPTSVFYGMVKETGQQNMELFMKMLDL